MNTTATSWQSSVKINFKKYYSLQYDVFIQCFYSGLLHRLSLRTSRFFLNKPHVSKRLPTGCFPNILSSVAYCEQIKKSLDCAWSRQRCRDEGLLNTSLNMASMACSPTATLQSLRVCCLFVFSTCFSAASAPNNSTPRLLNGHVIEYEQRATVMASSYRLTNTSTPRCLCSILQVAVSIASTFTVLMKYRPIQTSVTGA